MLVAFPALCYMVGSIRKNAQARFPASITGDMSGHYMTETLSLPKKCGIVGQWGTAHINQHSGVADE